MEYQRIVQSYDMRCKMQTNEIAEKLLQIPEDILKYMIDIQQYDMVIADEKKKATIRENELKNVAYFDEANTSDKKRDNAAKIAMDKDEVLNKCLDEIDKNTQKKISAEIQLAYLHNMFSALKTLVELNKQR